MCVVSMVGDHYGRKFDQIDQAWFKGELKRGGPTWDEFQSLKKEVEEMKILLKKAVEYDRKNNEPACQNEEKIEFLKKVAELVGVDISEVFK